MNDPLFMSRLVAYYGLFRISSRTFVLNSRHFPGFNLAAFDLAKGVGQTDCNFYFAALWKIKIVNCYCLRATLFLPGNQ
jgi:hypothetical protein